MSTELIQSLSNDHSRAQVEALLRGALREPAFAELGALLETWLDEHPGPLTALCRDTQAVTIDGWDALNAAFDSRAPGCTAVGIDLSGYWEATGPGFEVSFYTDASFPFSTSDRTELLAATEADAPVWQGKYEDVQPLLTCSGAETLDAALRDYPYRHWTGSDDMPDDFPAYFAAVWFLYLRINEALAHAITTGRLRHAIPIVVGQNDYGPAFETVYVTEQAASNEAEVSVLAQVPAIATRLAEVKSASEPVEATEVVDTVASKETVESSAPSRSWPWRRTTVRSDAGDTASTDPLTQRRRGPGTFAA